jgi:uridine monophosphate synthetase
MPYGYRESLKNRIMPSKTSPIPFEKRASSHPLSAYLFRLMVFKQSNLCLSADVSSAETLVHLASTIGPSIIVLKTHFDIISDWNPDPRVGTGAQLAALAQRHGFLIFEDRKFSDIGSTVQKQYTDGPGRIVEWAHITNAHILPGPAIVTALAEAASKWRERKKCGVQTDISVGTPRPESVDSDGEEETPRVPSNNHNLRATNAGRKASIVSVTTVSQHFEPADSSRASQFTDEDDDDETFAGIEEPPLERGLLLLAQMSSAGNLLDKKYTKTCVDIARSHKSFVMGYIAQESLNSLPEDQFLSMTPGCQLPPNDEEEIEGDGMGQQYNTPKRLVGLLGTDIIIVGRGITNAADPVAEAELYREKGWKSYEERIASSK